MSTIHIKKTSYKEIFGFYKGKKILITGNTGFKGSWLTHILLSAGAEVTGYSLQPSTDPSLFNILCLENRKGLTQHFADIRDQHALKTVFQSSRPEIVFHLAAQPIVRDSYKDPVNTYSTNIMGTVNICEAIRTTLDEAGNSCVRSFLNVTTDKVYKNKEWCWGYRETDELDGGDPYSNSKSCSELITHCYKDSFLIDADVRVSTARAGNVIGGGDFSNDRIIPDCIRAIKEADNGEAVINVRNPYSTRPYEHVLEPLFAYLLIAKMQYENILYADYYNVGPDDIDCVTTGNLVTIFTDIWNSNCVSPSCSWVNRSESHAPHEANFLKLDCSRLKSAFGWKSTWHIDEAVEHVISWTKVWLEGGDIISEMDGEIHKFIEDSDK
jgi:CDP-glucose 4,6-dehydratase